MLGAWRGLGTSQKKLNFEVEWFLVVCFSNMKAKQKKWWKNLSFLKKSLNPKIRIGLKKFMFDYGSQIILKLNLMFVSSYLQCHNQGVVQT